MKNEPHLPTGPQLRNKLSLAMLQRAEEVQNAELEEEVPTFAQIPDLPPSEPHKDIKREDVKMGNTRTDAQKEELFTAIMDYAKCLGKGRQIVPVTTFKAPMNTEGPLPPAQAGRPAGPAKREVIDTNIEQLLGWDVLEPSRPTTASLIVLVWHSNTWRFCVVFRQLNNITVPDAQHMLRADYVFSTLAAKRNFTLLDVGKGYYQLELEEADPYKTAFILYNGLCHYKELLFGLRKAPAQVQWMMDRISFGLRWKAAFVYIDNILIYSDTWEDHLKNMELIFKAAEGAGSLFSIDKYSFGYIDIMLLWHGLTKYRLHTLTEKVQTITFLTSYRSLCELHRILGMFDCYTSFIHQFAKISHRRNKLKKTSAKGTENHKSKKPAYKYK